ncbi:MAG: hypothetical protein Q7S96_01605 [bacterium]|nr:hypothetical protein [bacterium]
MKPGQLLFARVAGSVATIAPRNEPELTFLGSSCRASTLPGAKVSSVSFTLHEEQQYGVAAVIVDLTSGSGKNASKEAYPMLIKIQGAGQGDHRELSVDTENIWVPEGPVIGGIVHAFYQTAIEVVAPDGERFTTLDLEKARRYSDDYPELYMRYYVSACQYVPDPNLLLRCLVGDCTIDDVLSAAQQVAAEQTQLEKAQELVEKQERATERLRIENTELRARFGGVHAANEHLNDVVAQRDRVLSIAAARFTTLSIAARALHGVASTQWRRSRALEAALKKVAEAPQVFVA